MKESDLHCLTELKTDSNSLELNNNNLNMKMFDSGDSLISSESSSSSTGGFCSRRFSEEYLLPSDTSEHPDCNDCDMSNCGTNSTKEFSDKEQVDVFPIIPDQLLEEMGLIGDQTSNQGDEELENKFATLSLTMTIDSTTITDRCKRRKKSRDQTEKNLAVEIQRLTERVNSLTRLCVDMETTELVATILAQINIVVKASALAFSSAERYGAAQHEEKLSKDAQLMVKYVNSLKQKKDISKEQCMKIFSADFSKEEIAKREKQMTRQVRNPKLLSERRNSIATLKDNQGKPTGKFSRRTSECIFRSNGLLNMAKPNRKDLTADLVKIKEDMMVENDNQDDLHNSLDDADAPWCNDSDGDKEKTEYDEGNGVYCYLNNLQKKANILCRSWSQHEAYTHLYYLCSIFCFCFAVILMADILFELELSKR